MRFGEASVESALVWLGAIGERKACVCKCGMLLVSDRNCDDSSSSRHLFNRIFINIALGPFWYMHVFNSEELFVGCPSNIPSFCARSSAPSHRHPGRAKGERLQLFQSSATYRLGIQVPPQKVLGPSKPTPVPPSQRVLESIGYRLGKHLESFRFKKHQTSRHWHLQIGPAFHWPRTQQCLKYLPTA